jgi:lysophospholipase L1-like esterase
VRYLLACLVFAVHAAPPALTWDVSDHGGEMVVSGTSISRTLPAGPPWELARSRDSQNSGVRTVTFAIETLLGQAMVGIANGKAPIDASLGTNANSIGYWSNGNTLSRGTWGGSFPGAFMAGDTLGMQVDFIRQTVRFRINTNDWSDPLTTVALGPDLYVAVSMYAASGPVRIRIASEDWNDYPEPTVNVVAAGDSISLTSGVLKTYVPRLAELARADRKAWIRTQHFGINGHSWDYAWPSSGYPYTLLEDGSLRVDTARSTRLPNWLIAFAGTNGITIARHDAAYEYAKLQSYVRARIDAGWDPAQIIVCTMLPREGTPSAVRADYNARIVSGATALGYKVARLDLDPNIGADAASANPDYFSDGVHPTDAGHEVIARVIYSVMFP